MKFMKTNLQTLLTVKSPVADVAGETVSVMFWWFGYGYFSQEPGC